MISIAAARAFISFDCPKETEPKKRHSTASIFLLLGGARTRYAQTARPLIRQYKNS